MVLSLRASGPVFVSSSCKPLRIQSLLPDIENVQLVAPGLESYLTCSYAIMNVLWFFCSAHFPLVRRAAECRCVGSFQPTLLNSHRHRNPSSAGIMFVWLSLFDCIGHWIADIHVTSSNSLNICISLVCIEAIFLAVSCPVFRGLAPDRINLPTSQDDTFLSLLLVSTYSLNSTKRR
jgi:hypothetical protein